MGTVDWSLLPPSPWSDEELSEFLRRAAAENHARRGYNLSPEECRLVLEPAIAEEDEKRGYKLTPERKERQMFQYVFEARIVESRRRAAAAMQPLEYRYRPPRGPLVVREAPCEETQLDRIERLLSATRVQLEALETKINNVVDQAFNIARQVRVLEGRVDALAETVERMDLRVLSLENRIGRLESRMDRLETRVQNLEDTKDS